MWLFNTLHACMHACIQGFISTIKTHFDLIRTPNTVLWLQYIYDILVNRVVMYCTHHYNKIIAVFELWWQSNECTCLSMKLSLLVQQLIIFSSSRTKVHCGTEIVVPVWPYLHAMQKLHIFAVGWPMLDLSLIWSTELIELGSFLEP
jgi:hypothetical protein